jgi:hypothetical protein
MRIAVEIIVKVRMRVEVEDLERAVSGGERLHDREADRVVTA